MWWFSPAQEQALVVESLFAQWCGMTICDWPVHQKKNSSVILLFLHRAMGEEISEWLFVCVKILTPQLSCLRCVLSRVELFLSTTCTSFSESPQPLQWHIRHSKQTHRPRIITTWTCRAVTVLISSNTCTAFSHRLPPVKSCSISVKS